ncbi:MAG: enoyl-CoA hydratase/isomerase family protein [Acidimicrobiales bacterium]
MNFATIELVADGPRAWVWLSRPKKLNPLGYTTLLELRAAARLLDETPDVKVVVFAGRGRAFSAGADLSGVAGGSGVTSGGSGTSASDAHERAPSPREAADAGRRMIEAVEAMRPVTIAQIHGHCIGGALLLAAACDLRVASDDANFAIPEVDLGIPLAWGGIPRLVRDLGAAMTKELVLTCRSFGAEEAKALGFLNRVVPATDLEEEVNDLADLLTTKSALTLAATKEHVNAVANGMVGSGFSWNDADSLLSALSDPESRSVAAAYRQRLRARSKP